MRDLARAAVYVALYTLVEVDGIEVRRTIAITGTQAEAEAVVKVLNDLRAPLERAVPVPDPAERGGPSYLRVPIPPDPMEEINMLLKIYRNKVYEAGARDETFEVAGCLEARTALLSAIRALRGTP